MADEAMIEALPEVLAALLKEIASVDTEFFPPIDDVKPGEVVRGSITSPFTRKVFGLARFYHREAERNDMEMRYTPPGSDRDAELRDGLKAHEKHDVLMELFWWLARHEINHWVREGIGLRLGWKLVGRPEESRGPEAFFRRLIGGDE